MDDDLDLYHGQENLNPTVDSHHVRCQGMAVMLVVIPRVLGVRRLAQNLTGCPIMVLENGEDLHHHLVNLTTEDQDLGLGK